MTILEESNSVMMCEREVTPTNLLVGSAGVCELRHYWSKDFGGIDEKTISAFPVYL
jgi:hypothetical protein